MLSEIAQVWLSMTSEYFVIAFVSIGYLTYRKDAFARGLFILLFTMLLNPYLKSIFEVPLNPALGKEGWAFPSGHMQTTFALWGWLMWELRHKVFSALASLIIIGVGLSLVQQGYHTYTDVLGAIGFGFGSLLLYEVVCRFMPKDMHPYLGVFMAALGLGLIFITPGNLPHMWIAEGALVGFSLGWATYHAWDTREWLFRRRYLVASSFAGIVLLYLLTMPLKSYIGIEGFQFVRFFAIAFWISYGAEAFVFFAHKYTAQNENS